MEFSRTLTIKPGLYWKFQTISNILFTPLCLDSYHVLRACYLADITLQWSIVAYRSISHAHLHPIFSTLSRPIIHNHIFCVTFCSTQHSAVLDCGPCTQVMRALQLPPEAWLRLRGDNTNITENLGVKVPSWARFRQAIGSMMYLES